LGKKGGERGVKPALICRRGKETKASLKIGETGYRREITVGLTAPAEPLKSADASILTDAAAGKQEYRKEPKKKEERDV
jgi:hypothetical protein